MLELKITMNPETNEFHATWPKNFIIALGMLEAAKEMILNSQLRPAAAPRVVGASSIPFPVNKGN